MSDTDQELQEVTDMTPAEGMVQSLVPLYLEGDKKAAFLGYIVAGFSRAEAQKLAGIHRKTLTRWTQGDPAFNEFLAKLPEIRKSLSDQLVDIEYTRNFRLVLNKDFKVLFKDAMGKYLNEEEVEYLKVIRKFYTPQHLLLLRQLLSGDGQAKEEMFDWTKTVLEIRLSREEASHKRSS
jgi:hypothetical protein